MSFDDVVESLTTGHSLVRDETPLHSCRRTRSFHILASRRSWREFNGHLDYWNLPPLSEQHHTGHVSSVDALVTAWSRSSWINQTLRPPINQPSPQLSGSHPSLQTLHSNQTSSQQCRPSLPACPFTLSPLRNAPLPLFPFTRPQINIQQVHQAITRKRFHPSTTR